LLTDEDGNVIQKSEGTPEIPESPDSSETPGLQESEQD